MSDTPFIPPVLDPPPELGHYAQEKLRRIVAEIAGRQVEALRLYEPLPEQGRFHTSDVNERILRGSNRGGKTLPAAVEVARAVTGQDPHGKFPKENGRCFAVGKDGRHIGQVMWRKLSRAGAFRMIRDLQTGLWRAYRPWDPADAARQSETKPAGPLIPPRLIAEIAWENKKENFPSVVKLKTGWELTFFSSLAKPPNGADVDLVWFDEEIVDPDWYTEMAARLLDREGRFLWSATPQAGTVQLWDLHCRAVDGDPLAAEFVILLRDNPHISQKAKDELAAKLNDDEREVRIEGNFALAAYKVYPEYQRKLHNVPWFEIPPGWTRLLAVDPGRQVCAGLFLAVPPPGTQWGERLFLYGEIYIRGSDATKFAQAVAAKAVGASFLAFIIDGHAGRQTEIGSGRTVERQYADALKKEKVASERTLHGFVHGADDVAAGILAFRDWLRIRPDGTPRLAVLEHSCPNFEQEIGRYHYKRQGPLITDTPEKKNDHLMDCARYLAMYNPRYVKPKAGKKRESYAVRALRLKRERQRQKRGPRTVSLGPGGGPYGIR